MFKKLKDKLAEEVKSSPQRIQQFAQAAQAAVTSASSSISDITNTDLFSIGDNDKDQLRKVTHERDPSVQSRIFQDVSVMQTIPAEQKSDPNNVLLNQDNENQRQRRLSNSSFASDVSFRLPNYESPSMYQLQSDVDVSASEAEERGFSSGAVSLDRVTKEQIYSAYRRTQERYLKYRTQYSDLVRHYKLLERENAKARSVLVETQDKALRRISELREQCALEQSAKAHLEKALRVEIEEKNIQIKTLNTKIQLLRNIEQTGNVENSAALVSLADDENKFENKINNESLVSEMTVLNNKVEKLEQLVNKYKDSLKSTKEKNSQITNELQILSSELETKKKKNDELKIIVEELNNAKIQIQELNDLNEQLQNQINSYDFTKLKEISTYEIELEKSQDEIKKLREQIEIFTKNEEDYAISLAENKLSIHKELESKENEIKSLKDSLSTNQKEIQSLTIIIEDYKKQISQLGEENTNIKTKINELNEKLGKIGEYESQIQSISQKCQALENFKAKADEEMKCVHLQLKQEAAEKLAMIDRNVYLETRNSQLIEENSKKTSQISHLDSLVSHWKDQEQKVSTEKKHLMEDLKECKSKYHKVESEIQDERSELIKLQSEIENLIANHKLLSAKNLELNADINDLKHKNANLKETFSKFFREQGESTQKKVNDLKKELSAVTEHIKSFKVNYVLEICKIKKQLGNLLTNSSEIYNHSKNMYDDIQKKYYLSQAELSKSTEELAKVINELISLRNENNNLHSTLVSMQNELKDTKYQYESNADEKLLLLQKKDKIEKAFQQIEAKCHQLETDINTVNNDKILLVKKIEELSQVHQTAVFLQNELDALKTEYKTTSSALTKENESLKEKLNKVAENDKFIVSLTDKIKYIENENADLKNMLSILENDKINQTEKLLEKNKDLLQENILLKSQSERIFNDIKDLEIEIAAVRKSHSQITSEKDNLNSVIKLLEEKETENRQSQTVHIDQTETLDKFTNTEIEELPVTHRIQADESVPVRKNIEDEISNNATFSTNEFNRLKVVNQRLQSEITGLQTYLANISKENSTLNDKLREVMTSSESFSHQDESETKNYFLLSKIEELTRENTLLIEENLELKDQIVSQNKILPKPANKVDSEQINNFEKYNNLLLLKNQLEKRVIELEDMSHSFTGNMQEMQENNSKLRKSNENLERRLDEALVSLRHLHSLQENTELEYMRNILYEYLTGSGTHSITLAKVLAAVVKFDDRQTQFVLQKEKERQGLLRQLGLL